MRQFLIVLTLVGISTGVLAAEEKIRGVLEKTVRAGACAQITDALAETYYITKSDEAEKMIAEYVGKNVKVVITGTVESKEGDPAFYFTLKSVEPYTPKMPTADPKATPPAPDAKKEDKK
jgi:hypothetical protein